MVLLERMHKLDPIFFRAEDQRLDSWLAWRLWRSRKRQPSILTCFGKGISAVGAF